MNVKIVYFPETKVAVIEHLGSPTQEHKSVNKLIAWRIENKLPIDDKYRNYGVHFNNPHTTPAAEYQVDFCLSVEHDVLPNSHGIINKTIPASRCAVTRHLGSRKNMTAAAYLYERWLPSSGEALGGFPVFFHYVNVGPGIEEDKMITDVYLPLI